VQAALREVFAQWGRPTRLRVDNGYPWGSAGDLPPDLALWLIGLAITMIWNRPRHCQANGQVERAHGVSQQWAEPGRCRDVAMLQERLTWATRLQRERYPAIAGRSRLAAHPTLAAGGQPYDPAHEATQWDLAAVGRFLGQGLWRRRVDRVGRISLYNRSYGVGRRYAGQEVGVRFDAIAHAWVLLDAAGTEIRRHPATELSRDRILALEVTHRRPPPAHPRSHHRRPPR
jgi:hypothetical protein